MSVNYGVKIYDLPSHWWFQKIWPLWLYTYPKNPQGPSNGRVWTCIAGVFLGPPNSHFWGVRILRVTKNWAKIQSLKGFLNSFFCFSIRWFFFLDGIWTSPLDLTVHLFVQDFPYMESPACVCPIGWWNVRFFFKERLQLKRCHPHAHELQGEFFKFRQGRERVVCDEESDGGASRFGGISPQSSISTSFIQLIIRLGSHGMKITINWAVRIMMSKWAARMTSFPTKWSEQMVSQLDGGWEPTS